MTRTLLALALTALPALASAGDVAALLARAERVERLDAFLEKIVGRCVDPYTKKACEDQVAAARKSASGKTFVVKVSDATALVKPQIEGESYLLLLTPFVDGGGLALTNGTPVKQDAAGNPVVNLVPVRGTLPPGTMDLDFLSPFRTGAVDLEIVFQPTKPWKLPKKGGGGFVEGLGAKFMAVRLLDARSGNEIAARSL
jgi:hypothetical protein